jgi:N utilization substance protein A
VTFAQSALAPAKITRVSVTHHGEYPHLDVIVEDEQLSLAIGKRGQNVRLASELIGCRIDIKSESDVKDEVADALARMLQTAMSGMAAEGAADTAQDIGAIAGITPEIAEGLREAGLDGVEALLDAPRSELLAVEGVDDELADRLVDWAQDQSARREADAAEIGKAFRTPQASNASMGDEDFMAALSRAFQESEQQRSTVQWPGEEEAQEAPSSTEDEEVPRETE